VTNLQIGTKIELRTLAMGTRAAFNCRATWNNGARSIPQKMFNGLKNVVHHTVNKANAASNVSITEER